MKNPSTLNSEIKVALHLLIYLFLLGATALLGATFIIIIFSIVFISFKKNSYFFNGCMVFDLGAIYIQIATSNLSANLPRGCVYSL